MKWRQRCLPRPSICRSLCDKTTSWFCGNCGSSWRSEPTSSGKEHDWCAYYINYCRAAICVSLAFSTQI